MAARVLLICCAAACFLRAGEVDRFQTTLRALVMQAGEAPAFVGKDGWCFLTAELRAYAEGPHWGAGITEGHDPVKEIVAFHRQITAAGMSLLVVPVPGKIALHADRIDPALVAAGRCDLRFSELYARLRNDGVDVLDLTDDFARLRDQGVMPYCKQDSHWSPAGMALAARRIAERVTTQAWHAAITPLRTTLVPATISVRGDLALLLLNDALAAESLEITRVLSEGRPIPSDRASLVLMGDSHALVFHGSDLLAEDAGLPDHLAATCGLAVDCVGVIGSGANGSRMVLARRHDQLAGKRCLVWVFAARELCASADVWKSIPVLR